MHIFSANNVRQDSFSSLDEVPYKGEEQHIVA